MEKEKEKPPVPDPLLLLALRCSRASLLLSSLRQPLRSPATMTTTATTTTRRRSPTSSSPAEFELRNTGLLVADLAAARREAAALARISGVDLLLVVALTPLLFLLFVALLTAAATAEA